MAKVTNKGCPYKAQPLHQVVPEGLYSRALRHLGCLFTYGNPTQNQGRRHQQRGIYQQRRWCAHQLDQGPGQAGAGHLGT